MLLSMHAGFTLVKPIILNCLASHLPWDMWNLDEDSCSLTRPEFAFVNSDSVYAHRLHFGSSSNSLDLDCSQSSAIVASSQP